MDVIQTRHRNTQVRRRGHDADAIQTFRYRWMCRHVQTPTHTDQGLPVACGRPALRKPRFLFPESGKHVHLRGLRLALGLPPCFQEVALCQLKDSNGGWVTPPRGQPVRLGGEDQPRPALHTPHACAQGGSESKGPRGPFDPVRPGAVLRPPCVAPLSRSQGSSRRRAWAAEAGGTAPQPGPSDHLHNR